MCGQLTWDIRRLEHADNIINLDACRGTDPIHHQSVSSAFDRIADAISGHVLQESTGDQPHDSEPFPPGHLHGVQQCAGKDHECDICDDVRRRDGLEEGSLRLTGMSVPVRKNQKENKKDKKERKGVIRVSSPGQYTDPSESNPRASAASIGNSMPRSTTKPMQR